MNRVEKHRVVLVRDGENRADARGQFAGWLDCPLSEKGREEAIAAAKALKFSGLHFHSAHTSLLTRARTTLDIILGFLKQRRIILEKNWRLNERHLGALTGMKIFEAVAKYGAEKVNGWRYGCDSLPPAMDDTHRYFPLTIGDARYKEDPGLKDVPASESLATMWNRVLTYWDDVIIPQLRGKKTVLIVTHGDVIRGLVKFLDRVSDEEMEELSFLPGVPMIYDLDEDFNPVKPVYFLADRALVYKAMRAIHNRSKNVNNWRYGWDYLPPNMDETHKHFQSTVCDGRYKDDPGTNDVPTTESLRNTWKRVSSYWDGTIIPHLKAKKTVLIVTHGDVIRGIVKFLDRVSDDDIEKTTFLSGIPIVCDLDADFNPIRPVYFLAERNLVIKAMESVHYRSKNIHI